MLDNETLELAFQVLEHLRTARRRVVTVESCTGGLLSAALSSVAGSSDVLEGGFVTYSNALKTALVHVPESVLTRYGAVSLQTAGLMASGGLRRVPTADIAVSITGIAGPSGGTDQKPVGTVCFGIATRWSAAKSSRCQFDGDRAEIRAHSVREALKLLYRT